MFGLIEKYRAKLNLEVALSKLDFLITEMNESRATKNDLVYWQDEMSKVYSPYLDGLKLINHIRLSYSVHFKTFLKGYYPDCNEEMNKYLFDIWEER